MSVPGSLSTGADSPVMAASLTKPTPSMTSPSPGMVSPSETTTMSPRRSSDEPTVLERAIGTPPVGRGHGAGPPQRRGLGAAARLGDGLGVGREEDREPEPQGDLHLEAQACRVADRQEAGEVGEGDEGHEGGRDLDHEHDRVAGHEPRVELAHGLRQGGPQQLRVEHAARARRLAGRLAAAEGDEALEAAGPARQVDGTKQSHG